MGNPFVLGVDQGKMERYEIFGKVVRMAAQFRRRLTSRQQLKQGLLYLHQRLGCHSKQVDTVKFRLTTEATKSIPRGSVTHFNNG